jgi:hypothetical protein
MGTPLATAYPLIIYNIPEKQFTCLPTDFDTYLDPDCGAPYKDDVRQYAALSPNEPAQPA